MSVPEPDSLISNGLIIVRALLLPSLKKNNKKQQTDKLHNHHQYWYVSLCVCACEGV